MKEEGGETTEYRKPGECRVKIVLLITGLVFCEILLDFVEETQRESS